MKFFWFLCLLGIQNPEDTYNAGNANFHRIRDKYFYKCEDGGDWVSIRYGGKAPKTCGSLLFKHLCEHYGWEMLRTETSEPSNETLYLPKQSEER